MTATRRPPPRLVIAHDGTNPQPTPAGPHVCDVIVRLRSDHLFELRQVGARSDRFLEGPYQHHQAELRAIDLASDDGVDAWGVDGNGTFVLLT
jgi:hypothetical protein